MRMGKLKRRGSFLNSLLMWIKKFGAYRIFYLT